MFSSELIATAHELVDGASPGEVKTFTLALEGVIGWLKEAPPGGNA